MARSKRHGTTEPVEYAGDVWTDAQGRATVDLPGGARVRGGGFRYDLHVSDRRIGARVAAELLDGRFTIETDEPHVRVAWRARALAADDRREET